MTPGPRRAKLASFNDVIDAWFEDGCPNVAPSAKSRHARVKSPNTILNARQLLGTQRATGARPALGRPDVDRAPRTVFKAMAEKGYATSTIDRTWNYLNQACQHALRLRRIKSNPAADVLLPASRPSKPRMSFSIEQAQRLLVDAIPADARPAMWLTGLMCGLRPGEIAGLRWPFVDIDSSSPTPSVAERALEVEDRYVGQAAPRLHAGIAASACIPCSSRRSAGTGRRCACSTSTTPTGLSSAAATARP